MYTINNHNVSLVKFDNTKQLNLYTSKVAISKIVNLDFSYGDLAYLLKFKHSLNDTVSFAISYSGYSEDINLLYWDGINLLAAIANETVYIIRDFEVIATFELYTSFIGYYVTNENNLLILQECDLKIINTLGEVIMEKVLDFIENLYVKNDILYLKFENDEMQIHLAGDLNKV